MSQFHHAIDIFLAEDDEDDRLLFSEALSQLPLNCRVYDFKDGVELMAQLNSKNNQMPQLIFLDINMPRMSGHDCLKKIRETVSLCKLPVIIYSTSFNKREVEGLHNLGASGYLKKPASFNQLKTLLYKCIMPYSNGVNKVIETSFIIQL